MSTWICGSADVTDIFEYRMNGRLSLCKVDKYVIIGELEENQ